MKINRIIKIAFIGVFIAFLFASQKAGATTATFYPDKDSVISKYYSTQNYGNLNTIFFGACYSQGGSGCNEKMRLLTLQRRLVANRFCLLFSM